MAIHSVFFSILAHSGRVGGQDEGRPKCMPVGWELSSFSHVFLSFFSEDIAVFIAILSLK